MQQIFIFFALVVGPYGDLLGQVGDLLFKIDHLPKCRFRLGKQGCCIGHLHLLGQVADGAVSVTGNAARGGLLQTDQHLQHGRFAGSVFADQTDAVFRVDQKGDIFEQVPPSKTDGEVVN